MTFGVGVVVVVGAAAAVVAGAAIRGAMNRANMDCTSARRNQPARAMSQLSYPLGVQSALVR